MAKKVTMKNRYRDMAQCVLNGPLTDGFLPSCSALFIAMVLRESGHMQKDGYTRSGRVIPVGAGPGGSAVMLVQDIPYDWVKLNYSGRAIPARPYPSS
jgi:hypothetical protein